jgi:hypothetical protein
MGVGTPINSKRSVPSCYSRALIVLQGRIENSLRKSLREPLRQRLIDESSITSSVNFGGLGVARDGIEPPTPGFSIPFWPFDPMLPSVID